MTRNEILRRWPNASEDLIKANLDPDDSGTHSPKQEQPSRKPLDRPVQRENQSSTRFEICFRIYSVRPNDWDNPWTKAMQDLLIEAGILHGDAWNVLQGRVISEKAHSKEEERIEIEIFKL